MQGAHSSKVDSEESCGIPKESEIRYCFRGKAEDGKCAAKKSHDVC